MVEARFPKEVNIEKTCRGGMALVHYAFNYNNWEFRQETGADKGRDCSFEYIDENNRWQNCIIRGQVKGTKTPDLYLYFLFRILVIFCEFYLNGNLKEFKEMKNYECRNLYYEQKCNCNGC